MIKNTVAEIEQRQSSRLQNNAVQREDEQSSAVINFYKRFQLRSLFFTAVYNGF
jgi:hypothetical protein